MLHTISLSLFLWHLAGTHIVSVTGLVDSQHCTGLSVVNISNRRKRREERERKKKREREREAKYTIIWSNAHLVNYTFLHSSTLKKLQKTAVFRHCSNCSLLPRQHDRDTGLLSWTGKSASAPTTTTLFALTTATLFMLTLLECNETQVGHMDREKRFCPHNCHYLRANSVGKVSLLWQPLLPPFLSSTFEKVGHPGLPQHALQENYGCFFSFFF